MSGKHSHHLKYVKQQYRDRKLVQVIVQLIEVNDHDSLAYIARTAGIPPQLRFVVWPILLKYHPMCISPNIMSNTVVWDPTTSSYHLTNADQKQNDGSTPNNDNEISKTSTNSSGSEEVDRDMAQMEKIILKDLKKYFLTRVPPTSPQTASSSSSSTIESMPTLANECEIIDTLKDAIIKFLNKWSRIFKYEIGLSWIALGLAEWYPCLIPSKYDTKDDNFIVLSGRRHAHMSNNNNSTLNSNSLCYLFNEYPLASHTKSKLPNETIFSFDQLYERLALVLLHSPDTAIEQSKIKKDFPQDSMHIRHYFPILSGGDLSFRTQVFFKVFSSILPELYQPLTEEINLQPNSSRTSWLYWWFKCSGARALQRQDRGRIWDLFLGWRPNPNKNSINFYLNYNTKSFGHLYNKSPELCKSELWKEIEHNDTFWFPDLDTIPLGTPPYTHDVTIIKELLRRNQYDEQEGTINGDHLHNQENGGAQIPFSIISPHTQLIFIYVAILQFNEFKLLEFEETEIGEFLNNVPMLSKADDTRFRKLFDNGNTIDHQVSHDELSKRPSTSSNPHMLIEVGSDGKSSHSFNDIMKMAGDIWRKWLWRELEESLNNDP
ncbi:Oxidant-induced cell-cycle arrest protein 5 [Nakaseomyces bracarensis]|uniref:Oxidant-induced cell-cycle arrest protein 5 n=1 Tax=Nakaseomyces bracarensis TaxID=273131 RepID=A0ABR4NTD4_9SACH